MAIVDNLRTRRGFFGWSLLVDLALIAAAVAVYFLFPFSLGFATRVLIVILFVLSLDLILGYAGVASLGHAAMFGTGAYAAGLFSIHISRDPLLGLGAAALAGAAIAFVSGLLLMRTRGLTLLMMTIAIALMLQEVANKARDITGGADGLRGIRLDPILGIWRFDFVGKTGYVYALVVLVLAFIVLRVVVASPFGLSIRGIHDSTPRMRAIGAPVYWRLVQVYTLAGGIAGLAGGLSAQITGLVSIEAFNFTFSAEALIMLILGGAGRLYGAILGTVVFMVVHHWASAVDPYNWLFLIGAMVLAVVFVAPQGLMTIARLWQRGPGK